MKVHTTGGYLTHVACGYKHAYGVEDGDVMGCVADIGWAVGHGVGCPRSGHYVLSKLDFWLF